MFPSVKTRQLSVSTLLEWCQSPLVCYMMMFVSCGFTAQTHNPPQLRSTGMGTLLSRFSSAVFMSIASRLPDTLPFWIALISLKRKQVTDSKGWPAYSLSSQHFNVTLAAREDNSMPPSKTVAGTTVHKRNYSFQTFQKGERGQVFCQDCKN